MISTFTMERPAMSPTAAPVGAALAALPGSAKGFGFGFGVTSSPAMYAIDGVKPNVCHDWTTRDRQVGITTLRSSRHLRSPRT